MEIAPRVLDMWQVGGVHGFWVISFRVLRMLVRSMEQEGHWQFLRPVPGSEALPEAVQKDVTKITVVGVGNVGTACAVSIISKGLCRSMVLVDVIPDKLQGERLDLQHAAAFHPNVHICATSDYEETRDSQICIVTAGASQKSPDESRLSLVQSNVGLMKKIIPQLVKYSPNTLLLMVSNPVDILAYIAWKISGLPPNRVLGSGTNLDSSRIKFLIGSHLDVDAKSVHGYIIGEHGDSSVPVWSSVNVAGVPLLSYIKKAGLDDELKKIHDEVVKSAYEVIKLKGYTNWAIGASVANLVRSLIRDEKTIHPVSVLARGMHGIEHDVYLSLPCVLGRNGALKIIEQCLNEDEVSKLRDSQKSLWNVLKDLDL